MRSDLQARIDAFCKEHPELDADNLVASIRVLEGEPSQKILDTAKSVLADLIVMGSRGHTALGEILIGSVAHKVTVKTTIPVLLVPITH